MAQATAALECVTPGPWWVCIDDDGNPLSGRPSVQAPEDCDCAIVHWDGFVQEYWRSARGDKEIQANARFIAFAREWVPEAAARLSALTAQVAELTQERDRIAKANHRQAYCIQLTAQAVGVGISGAMEELPKEASRLRDRLAKLVDAAEGLSAILDKHETKGPLPDVAMMLCWLAAQNIRAVLRGNILEKPE